MSVFYPRLQAQGFACHKGSTSDTMGQINPALLPLFEQSAGSLMGYQQQNPLTGFEGSMPQQTAQLTPLEQMGMGGTAALGQPSYLQAMALGNIMNADEYAGAGPTTGQPNPGNDLSLQQLMQFISPQQAQINGGSDSYSPPPLGPSPGPPAPGPPPPGPGSGGDQGGGGKTYSPQAPPQGLSAPQGGPDNSLYQQSLQNYLGGSNAADYLHGQGFNFNQGPSAGTTFNKGGQSYTNVGAGHEGAGPGGESQFLSGLGVQGGPVAGYGGDIAKADRAMASVAQGNLHQRAMQLTTADKQRMAASGTDIFGNHVGGSQIAKPGAAPVTSPPVGTSTVTRPPSGGSFTPGSTAQASSYSGAPPLVPQGITPQGAQWVPSPRQQPIPPVSPPSGPPTGGGQPPRPPVIPGGYNPPTPDPGPFPGTQPPPGSGRAITFSGGPGPSDVNALQGAVGANGQLTGATPFGQSPGIQAAGQKVQGVDIMNDPAVAAALQNFQKLAAPQIQDQSALAGLGNSSALTNALGTGESQMMTPLYLDAINREQQRLQGVTGATENELNRRQATDFNVSNTHNQMIQNLLGLQGQQYGQQAGAAQAQLGAGGIQRGVEQQGNEAQYNDMLRQQALAEQAVGMPFGAFAPSALGSKSITQGK